MHDNLESPVLKKSLLKIFAKILMFDTFSISFVQDKIRPIQAVFDELLMGNAQTFGDSTFE